jgi:hypothetical protein
MRTEAVIAKVGEYPRQAESDDILEEDDMVTTGFPGGEEYETGKYLGRDFYQCKVPGRFTFAA